MDFLKKNIKRLENGYYYEGHDLGAVWTKERTTFKVWAPLAESVSIRLYKSGDTSDREVLETLFMKEDESGVFCLTVEDDLNGIYYTYIVERDGEEIEACDPYARAVGVNGERAMVIDLKSTDPEGWESDMNPHIAEGITDAVIYEGHIRDLTAAGNSGIVNKGKFLGLCETGTKTANGEASGIDHMKDLGITHLHVLPMYDFSSLDEKEDAPGYNWGYDPKNYNAPEGTYATDPYDAALRINELKQMIKTLHDNKISVVMDVVYNHVADAAEFSFNKIVPGYFVRTDKKGRLSNGSGCGNDTASERPMVRKFIEDSVLYWATEYHIDGFRFDLAGLLDTKTINGVINCVKKVRPDVIFYGEGWDIPTATDKKVSLAIQKNSEKMPEFALFNDTMRDMLRGGLFDKTKGYVTGNLKGEKKLAQCFKGLYKWCKSPDRSINYVS
ncbi:MAG: type I pullulanase, partial [Lachnospiraceae bacterium]|nr:type I pullulanase [Lachnospiraceae bacterium]